MSEMDLQKLVSEMQDSGMQDKFQNMQQELESKVIEGKSGGGLVKIAISADMTARSIVLSPDLANEDRNVVEDLIIAAINDALNGIKENSVNMIMNGDFLAGDMKSQFDQIVQDAKDTEE